jgi:hypothetical protein
VYKLIFFISLFLIFSCRDKEVIPPTDPKLYKREVSHQFINQALEQAKILKSDTIFFKLNYSLVKLKNEHPPEYRKFENLQGDIERANFLKSSKKFRKIWKKLGYHEKELMNFVHIKVCE